MAWWRKNAVKEYRWCQITASKHTFSPLIEPLSNEQSLKAAVCHEVIYVIYPILDIQ